MAMNVFTNPLNIVWSQGALIRVWMYLHKRERRDGKGGSRDRGLNQKSLEFCKYFSAYFTRTANRVNTLPRVSPGSWKSSISVKSQFYLPRSQSSPYVNPKPTFQALSHTSHLPFRAKVFYVYHWMYLVGACFDSPCSRMPFRVEEPCYHNL